MGMDISELITPFVFVDEDILKRNIRRMADACQERGIGLRPHVKTHNIPEIAHMQTAAGSSGVTVATLREAKAMTGLGMKDVFIARQICDAPELDGLAGLMAGSEISLAVDSVEGAELASARMKGKGLELKVLIEIDTGARRCGLDSADKIIELAKRIAKLPGLKSKGIFTHEGHVYSVKSRDEMNGIVEKAIQKMSSIAESLKAAGLAPTVVSIGSTPTMKYATNLMAVTEVRPGNYVFNDAMQVANGTVEIADCALRAVATVISRPADDRAVINIGSKSLGSDKGAGVSGTGGFGLVIQPERHIACRIYEEHSVIEGKNSLRIGQRVELIPVHACVAANLAPEIFVFRSGRLAGSWKNTRYSPAERETPALK